MNKPILNHITKSIALAFAGGALMLGAAAAFAAEDIVESARAGCQKELDTFCKAVTPGEGRVLQCLSSHNDKLSERCNYALADAAMQVQRVTLAIKHVAIECKGDLEKHCSDVPLGDGRIAECLKKNQATLVADCSQAMKDTQMQIK